MVVMQMEDMHLEHIDRWRKMVEDAGGLWVGVQQSFDAVAVEPLVVFSDPISKNLRALSVSQMTPENVAGKLGNSKMRWKTFLQGYVARLRAMADEIEDSIK